MIVKRKKAAELADVNWVGFLPCQTPPTLRGTREKTYSGYMQGSSRGNTFLSFYLHFLLFMLFTGSFAFASGMLQFAITCFTTHFLHLVSLYYTSIPSATSCKPVHEYWISRIGHSCIFNLPTAPSWSSTSRNIRIQKSIWFFSHENWENASKKS